MANEACREDSGDAKRCVDEMNHITGESERFGAENANVESEDRGANEGWIVISESVLLHCGWVEALRIYLQSRHFEDMSQFSFSDLEEEKMDSENTY